MRAKILIVEDDSDIARLLSFILSADGYELVLAADDVRLSSLRQRFSMNAEDRVATPPSRSSAFMREGCESRRQKKGRHKASPESFRRGCLKGPFLMSTLS